MKKTFLFIIVSFIASHSNAIKPVYLDANQSIEVRVKDALSKMTLEEKVKLCTAQSKFSSHGVPRLGIPELWMTDGPHGIREEILWDSWDHAGWTNDSCTAFPALTCLAASWNPEMSYLYGKAIGEEARYRRKDILLGPGVNIVRTPLNGRNFEYLGEDPYLSSKMAIPYIKGVQENGVAACVKHLALNNQEKGREYINVEVSDRALHEIYLPAFKSAVTEANVWSIMGAYNKFRGEFASHNNLLINTILKKSWNFDGCVITDWGATHDTKQAALNGTDIEMGTGTNGLTLSKANAYDSYFLGKEYLKQLKTGAIPESNINDKASRILRLIFRTAMSSNRSNGFLVNNEHLVVARTIAEEGIVLLQNEQKLLPITPSKYKTIAVIGENATRSLTIAGGSSELKVKQNISPLQGIIEKFGADKVSYTLGYASGAPDYNKVIESKYNGDSLKNEAFQLASKSDLVIFIGGLNKNYHQDCEGEDRESFSLPFKQNELIDGILKVNKNVVVVMISGSAYEMPWQRSVPAILQAWYLGSESGSAIANVLSGDVNPSGKLPFTFPVKLSDVGAHSFGSISYPGDGEKVIYKDDIFVGYRWYDTKKITPLFPFGFGLSYTKFEYGKAILDKAKIKTEDKVSIKIPVKNTGKFAGKEVVELYVSQSQSSEIRPEKELKAFKKITLNPGEQQSVEFVIDKSALHFYSDLKKEWVVEPGEFVVSIGSSSRDIRSTTKLKVE